MPIFLIKSVDSKDLTENIAYTRTVSDALHALENIALSELRVVLQQEDAPTTLWDTTPVDNIKNGTIIRFRYPQEQDENEEQCDKEEEEDETDYEYDEDDDDDEEENWPVDLPQYQSEEEQVAELQEKPEIKNAVIDLITITEKDEGIVRSCIKRRQKIVKTFNIQVLGLYSQ